MTDERPRIYPGDGDPRHGTENGYGNLRCRCNDCRTAFTKYLYQRRLRRVERGLAPEDPRHGTSNGYGNWGCRCRPCTDAWSADTTARARRRKDRAA